MFILSCKHGYSHLYLQLQQVVWRPLEAAKQLEWILSSRLSSDVLRKSVRSLADPASGSLAAATGGAAALEPVSLGLA